MHYLSENPERGLGICFDFGFGFVFFLRWNIQSRSENLGHFRSGLVKYLLF